MSVLKYETLYNGERIPRLGLGTWRLGGGMSPSRGQDAGVIKLLQAAIEMGYTHLDTSEMYAGGHTEELIGQAIQGFDRQSVFITTKVWSSHLHYRDVLNACEGSLKRLGLETIDLYLIHWPNPDIPLDETFHALNELVEAGKVRHLGVCNFDLERLQQAQVLSKTPLATDQVPYSLRTRTYVLNGVLEYCQKNGILLTAYSPIEQGNVLESTQLQAIARRHGATPAQVALAWLIHQPKVIAIPMSSNLEHLKSNLEALDLELFPDDLERLDQAELPEGSIWPR
jgi:diketogulonate reductase-like aldo/keto reductase